MRVNNATRARVDTLTKRCSRVIGRDAIQKKLGRRIEIEKSGLKIAESG
jgi:hypothetical protein